MKKMWQLKNKATWLLLTGILVLCTGFLVIGCGIGSGPQVKVQDPDTGQYAIDFSLAPSSAAIYLSSAALQGNAANFDGKKVTVEAWIKRRAAADGDFDGVIFGRMLSKGIALFVTDSVPKFAIKRSPTSSPGVTEPVNGACVGVHTTSTECIVEATSALADNTWTHVAGVLTTEDQSGSAVGDCPTYGAWVPHLAIYINGVLNNCANTGPLSNSGLYAETPALPYEMITVGLIGDGVDPIDTLDGGANTGWVQPLQGAFDEIRSWIDISGTGGARTEAQIQECMDEELALSGSCSRQNTNLLSYFRFNEGEHDGTADWAGLGSGGIESPATVHWSGGWVAGAPVSSAD